MLKIDENLNNNKQKQKKLIKFEIFRLDFNILLLKIHKNYWNSSNNIKNSNEKNWKGQKYKKTYRNMKNHSDGLKKIDGVWTKTKRIENLDVESVKSDE